MDFINEIINKRYNTNRGYLYFVDLLKEKYPDFEINYENLKTLTIKEMTQSYFKEHAAVAEYVATRNEIKLLIEIESIDYVFSDEELIDSFLHELIHAITSKIEGDIILEGINQRDLKSKQSSYFVAINEGITQFIVNDLLGKESDAYLFETNIAKQLAMILGKENLITVYSKNDPDELIREISKIDKDFDIRTFVINMWASYMVINGFLDNGEDNESYTRITEIQKQLLDLYLKTNQTNYMDYAKIMLDSLIAEEIVNPKELVGKIKLRDINNLGFKNIDAIKNKLLKIIDEVEMKNIERNEELMIVNKKEEYLQQGYQFAQEMVMRIRSGEVIKDVTDDSGERTVVTLTSRGTYGYQVYENFSNEPHYYAEGLTLIDDLNKTTDNEGRGLRYVSAKSRVQRNLTGVFSEYILDKGFHSFYISLKFPEDSEIHVTQRMAGYDRQDPVVLLGCQFDAKNISVVADTQPIVENGKQTIRIGIGAIKEDGTIDYDLQYKMAIEAENAKRFLGEKAMNSEQVREAIITSSKRAQSLFYNVYRSLNIPIMEGVTPNDLISDQINALLPENSSESPKLN